MNKRRLKAAFKAAGEDALESLKVFAAIIAIVGVILLAVVLVATAATVHPFLGALSLIAGITIGFAIRAGAEEYRRAE